MMHYAKTQVMRGKLKPGSWAEGIIDAVDRGEVYETVRPVLMIDYMGPSLDTTIYAIGSGVWLFANHPEQWRKVCEIPSLVASAISEVLRMEAPIQGFSRLFTREYDMDGSRHRLARERSRSTARQTATNGSFPCRDV